MKITKRQLRRIIREAFKASHFVYRQPGFLDEADEVLDENDLEEQESLDEES